MDQKTTEAVRLLMGIKARPGMYFGSADRRSYFGICLILLGFRVGARKANEEELYWGKMEIEVKGELFKMIDEKELSEQEKFDLFFEALDVVLKRDYIEFAKEIGLI